MNRLKNTFMWLVIVIIIVLSLVNIFLTIQASVNQEETINKRVEELVKSIQIPKVINGKDGINGIDGKNSLSTHTVETIIQEKIIKESEQIKGDAGNDGLTPFIQCNTSKNRWEIRYDTTSNWRILGENPVKCTIDV